MNWSFVSDQRIHVKIVDAQLVVGIDGQFEESTPVVVVEVEVNMEAKRHDDTSYGGQHVGTS
ncbi:hypothetical protein KXD40_007161 [Peronospora effusa]|nr:hypothetical protein KXD40_007161 [Peronospora effusa]